MKRAWITVAAASALLFLTDWVLQRDGGLVRTATTRGNDLDVRDATRVRAIDLNDLDRVPGFPALMSVHWTGAWHVASTGLYDLAVGSHGRSSMRIDGHVVHEVVTAADSGAPRTILLTAGFHQLEITHDPDPASPRLAVAFAKTGERLAPLSGRALKPRFPRNPRLRAVGATLRSGLAVLLIVTLVVAIRRTIPTVLDRWRRARADHPRAEAWQPQLVKAVAWTALVVILSYGALLRLDAITGAYGPVTSPRWLSALQTRDVVRPEAIRPASLVWKPVPLFPHVDGPPSRYLSDPWVFLQTARGMQSFYQAHYREPVFPFVTKVFLWLLHGQDVAVSFASASFAMLAIFLTYILGAAVWSRGVGLAAALGLALDADAIALSSAGWRDDAFVATVPLTAYALLRCWRAGCALPRSVRVGRLSVDAAYVEALILGIVAGLASLVRFPAVSFIVPGVGVLLLTMRGSWRRRLTIVGVTFITAVIVAGPYFVNCWRVYGDPIYTFNVHPAIYSFAEGKGESKQSTVGYVASKFASAPVEMTDTIARGLTTYPFSNKWQGLDRWIAGLGRWASTACLAGLIVLAASASGRLMLFVMVMSLVPFAFTWTVDPNWRFTAHVYPFLLIAAAVAASCALRGIRSILVPRWARAAASVPVPRTSWWTWASLGTIGLLGLWVISSILPRALFVESVRLRDGAMLTAGARDTAFLASGWSGITGGANVRMRVATEEGVLTIPLPGVDDYDVTLRLDPFPRPFGDTAANLPLLDISLNGTPISTLPLRWSADRVGAYDLRLPRALVRGGDNRLALRLRRDPDLTGPVQAGMSHGAAFGLWYVRIRRTLTARLGL